jgi:hypothetical protein
MAARGYIRKLVKVNQQELHRLIETEAGSFDAGLPSIVASVLNNMNGTVSAESGFMQERKT